MAKNLHIGDIVRLNSGGPWMTVTGFLDDGWTIQCHWFDEADQSNTITIPAEALEAETPRPDPGSKPASIPPRAVAVHPDYYRR